MAAQLSSPLYRHVSLTLAIVGMVSCVIRLHDVIQSDKGVSGMPELLKVVRKMRNERVVCK